MSNGEHFVHVQKNQKTGVFRPSLAGADSADAMLVVSGTGETFLQASPAGSTTTYTGGTEITKGLPKLDIYTSGTGVYTIAEDGVYAISCNVSYSSPGAGGFNQSTVFLVIFTGTSPWPSFGLSNNLTSDAGFFTTHTGSTVAVLEAGDTFSVVYSNNKGADIVSATITTAVVRLSKF